MTKYTLIAEHTDMFGKQLTKTTHEFDVDYIGDVLENVELFLRGVGFVLDHDAHLDFVNHEEFDHYQGIEEETVAAQVRKDPWPEAHYGNDLRNNIGGL